MLRRIAIGVLLCVATVALAQTDGWVQVAVSADGSDTYSIKLHSGERTQNKQGQNITVVVGQDNDNARQSVQIEKWYVTESDCQLGYGDLVFLDINGNYVGEAPFASGSKNIGSAIAAAICAAGSSVQSKGISNNVQS